jgi:hypothetical protein
MVKTTRQRLLVGSLALALAACAAGRAAAQSEAEIERAEQTLRRAGDPRVDKVDFFMTGDVGYRLLRITKVDFPSASDLTPKLIPGTSHAVAPGLSAGLRLWFLSLAARGDVAFFNWTQGPALDDQFRMYSLDLEIAFRAPLGRLEPYLMFGGGFSGLGGIANVLDETRHEASSRGGNVRAGLGVDYFMGRFGILGLRGTMEAVFLSSTVPVLELLTPQQVDTLGQAEDRVRDTDGLIGGYSMALALVWGFRL